jgi:hypothetical protein
MRRIRARTALIKLSIAWIAKDQILDIGLKKVLQQKLFIGLRQRLRRLQR